MTHTEREEEKKRLYELIAHSYTSNRSKWEVELFNEYMRKHEIPKLVDDLLDGGVIVPPCKVGDVVYSIGKLDGKVHREKVQYFNYDSEDQRFWFGIDGPGVFTSEHIGKWVFFTREAAKRALKERDDHGT